jgi:hypothetical protein
MDFIDQHRDRFGVEPICKVLPIAPSTYFPRAARHRDPALRSDRAKRDAALIPEVQRIHRENFSVYGVRKSGGRCAGNASRLPVARWSG